MNQFSRILLETTLPLTEEAPLTHQDLKAVERYADDVFRALKIDVEFTKHFFDRVNDPRNKKQITKDELIRLFNLEYKKNGGKIGGLRKDAEAILKDLGTNINVPFVMTYNKPDGMLELTAKTVLRKKGFKSSDRSFVVEDTSTIFETCLLEAFDNPYKFIWMLNRKDYARAVARLENDNRLEVVFYQSKINPCLWEIEFTVNGTTAVTNGGDQFRVFSTVLSVISDFLKKTKNIEELTFSAVKDPDEVNSSRSSLYNRMIRRFAGTVGFELSDATSKGNKVVYHLARKATTESLTEAFDNPYRLSWKGSEPKIKASTKVEDNRTLDIIFAKYPSNKNAWELAFTVNGSLDVTGGRDAYRIFATVLSALQKFITEKVPSIVTFSAAKSEDRDASSRSRLYTTMVRKIAPKLGYEFKSADIGSNVIYVLTKAA